MNKYLQLSEIVKRHEAVVVDSTILDPVRDACRFSAEYVAELDSVLRGKNVVTHPMEYVILDFWQQDATTELLATRVVPYVAFEGSLFSRLSVAVQSKIECAQHREGIPVHDAGGLALALLYGTMVSTAFLTSRKTLAGHAEHLAKSLQLDMTPYVLIPAEARFLHPDRKLMKQVIS